ncbi:hypothetical protein JZ751_002247 [Albula glossodonta]|uniref:Rho-GAP domain-containing protein n=1 Tax=Albula glossodonta TaxID=121402 RepID=A0A8T2PBB6_9TELE|nr:hypothetical protein JZ751_002247 [Albula glossodonta]
MTDTLVSERDLNSMCEHLEHCSMGSPVDECAPVKRPPNTGAKLWGRVRSKILRQKIKVEFSMKFTGRDLTLKRTPSKKQSGVFGVKIGVVTKRECSRVPFVIRQCIEEVEKRDSTKDFPLMLSDMDINAIAGTLKLYFRELPEALLTDRLYLAFLEGVALSDPVAKETCMMQLLCSLPDPNLFTFLTLLEHLRRVAEKETVNKMSLLNLATIFGPTLLRPSEENSKGQITLLSDIWSHDVMAQVQVLLYYLQRPPVSFSELKRNTIYFSADV